MKIEKEIIELAQLFKFDCENKNDEAIIDYSDYFNNNPERLDVFNQWIFKIRENERMIKEIGIDRNDIQNKIIKIFENAKKLSFKADNIISVAKNAEYTVAIDSLHLEMSNLIDSNDNLIILLELDKLIKENINSFESEKVINPEIKKGIKYAIIKWNGLKEKLVGKIQTLKSYDDNIKQNKIDKITLELNKSQIAYLIVKLGERGIFKKHKNLNYLKRFSDFFLDKDGNGLTNDSLSKAIYNFENSKNGSPKNVNDINDFLEDIT